MVRVWQNYLTDRGRAYPLFALSSRQVNEVSTTINPLDLLLVADTNQLIEVKNSCTVAQLVPRQINIYAADGAQFLINYWQPFSQNLFDYFTNKTEVAAFEFIGERIKYGRLRRMLDNV